MRLWLIFVAISLIWCRVTDLVQAARTRRHHPIEISNDDRPPECSVVNITDCKVQAKPIDLIYLVDASESLDRNIFYTDLNDYLKLMHCTLNESLPNQASLILFSNRIEVRVPLDYYSTREWFDQVDLIKSDP